MLCIVMVVLMFVASAAGAQSSLGEIGTAPLADVKVVSDPMFAAGLLGIISLAASIVTMGVKSKGWPAWLQPLVDGLNLIALNVFKNKNADANDGK